MIVIPMAGLSSRFAQAGYDRPKYMLPLGKGFVFDHAVGSFRHLFDTTPFLIVTNNDREAPAFAEARSRALGVRDLTVVALDRPTAGQAETVALGLAGARLPAGAPVTIFNIDTFRPGFLFPTAPWWEHSDGYLEVFEGEGANWSYVRAGSEEADPRVLETAEKRPISSLCCTGLYHFARSSDMLEALEAERIHPSARELYVAPLYNHLIRRGARIHYHLIDRTEVRFCGVPREYELLRIDEESSAPVSSRRIDPQK